MEQEKYRHPENTATDLIKNDYLNTYLPLLELGTRSLEYVRSRRPKSFSERYPNMTYNNFPFVATEGEIRKIQELDALSVEVNQLIYSEEPELGAILKIGISVAEICSRTDIAEKFRLKLIDLGKK